jgi:hypothetical protein
VSESLITCMFGWVGLGYIFCGRGGGWIGWRKMEMGWDWMGLDWMELDWIGYK